MLNLFSYLEEYEASRGVRLGSGVSGILYTTRFGACPKQANNTDCGLFALANATALAAGCEPGTLQPLNIPQLRRFVLQCLLQGKVPSLSEIIGTNVYISRLIAVKQ